MQKQNLLSSQCYKLTPSPTLFKSAAPRHAHIHRILQNKRQVLQLFGHTCPILWIYPQILHAILTCKEPCNLLVFLTNWPQGWLLTSKLYTHSGTFSFDLFLASSWSLVLGSDADDGTSLPDVQWHTHMMIIWQHANFTGSHKPPFLGTSIDTVHSDENYVIFIFVDIILRVREVKRYKIQLAPNKTSYHF